MILITGGNGKIGKSLIKKLKKENIVFLCTHRSTKYKKIDNSNIGMNLNNENHIKRLFKNNKIQHLVHLAVTRNPMEIKEIRSFETMKKDTYMTLNLLKYSSKLKSVTFTSTGAIYSKYETNLYALIDKIIQKIFLFIQKKTNKGVKIDTFSNVSSVKYTINPIVHKNDNKRLNGSSKLINELLLTSYCMEKKIPLYILRPFYVKS